jgi:hypothetical protein
LSDERTDEEGERTIEPLVAHAHVPLIASLNSPTVLHPPPDRLAVLDVNASEEHSVSHGRFTGRESGGFRHAEGYAEAFFVL